MRVREHVALAHEHSLTARWKGVNAHEHMYSRTSCVNHARDHVALACEHPLTARRKGVGAREYILVSIKFKMSVTVSQDHATSCLWPRGIHTHIHACMKVISRSQAHAGVQLV